MKSQKGKHFCILPWVHLQMSPNGKIHSCCQTTFRQSLGDANTQTLEEVWKGDAFEQLRKRMLNDERIEECKLCYLHEELGHHSLRTLSNEEYSDVDTSVLRNPIYLDLRLDNKCNFKCRSCNPVYSSRWKSDFEKLRPDLPVNHNEFKRSEQAYQQVKAWLPEIKKIYFAGGEPLISRFHTRILQDLIEAKNFDAKLLYNTNFSTVSDETIKLWGNFKLVAVSASIDGTREIGEFIRNGFRWNQFLENRQRVREQSPHIHFKIDWTLSVYNVFHLPTAIHDLLQSNVIDSVNQIYINYLFDPPYLSPKILSANEKDELKAHYGRAISGFQGRLNSEELWAIIGLFSRILKFVQEPVDTSLRIDFKIFNNKLDKIRSESSRKLFPELENLI